MPRGAQRQFDRTEVLEKAMQLFWEKGYEASGLSELTDRMGIGRQSLYNVFTDKKGLFLDALDHYVATRLDRVRETLEAPGSPLKNLRRVLALYEEHNTTVGSGLGCLLVNSLTEIGPSDKEVSARIRSQLEHLEGLFRAAFERAKKAGEIRADASPRALARSMCAVACGVCAMGRAGMSKSTVRDAIRTHETVLDAVAVS